MKRIRHVIWDWNGTLLDDAALCSAVLDRQLERRGLEPIGLRAYREVLGFPIEGIYRRMGFDMGRETFAALNREFLAGYHAGRDACRLQRGVRKALAALQAAGVSCSILSASEQGSLREAVARFGLSGRFREVYGIANTRADGKMARGADLLAALAVDPAEALLIGDTDHDAAVAGHLGLACVLVRCGHQSRRRLLACGRPVLESPGGLPAALGLAG